MIVVCSDELLFLLEQVIHRLYHFLEHHDILFANQFGFWKNNYTYYVLEITEKIKVSIDSGKFGCGISIELRKAFDAVVEKEH